MFKLKRSCLNETKTFRLRIENVLTDVLFYRCKTIVDVVFQDLPEIVGTDVVSVRECPLILSDLVVPPIINSEEP